MAKPRRKIRFLDPGRYWCWILGQSIYLAVHTTIPYAIGAALGIGGAIVLMLQDDPTWYVALLTAAGGGVIGVVGVFMYSAVCGVLRIPVEEHYRWRTRLRKQHHRRRRTATMLRSRLEDVTQSTSVSTDAIRAIEKLLEDGHVQQQANKRDWGPGETGQKIYVDTFRFWREDVADAIRDYFSASDVVLVDRWHQESIRENRSGTQYFQAKNRWGYMLGKLHEYLQTKKQQ